MYRFIIYMYMFVSLLASYYIVRSIKPKRWLVSLLITFWFTITPVVGSRVFYSINPFSHITGTSWRIDFHISLVVLAIIILKFLSQKSEFPLSLNKINNYEKFFYLYMFLSVFVSLHHLNAGNIPEHLRKITLFFHYELILFFFAMSLYIDRSIIKCIIKAAVFMSIISTIISPIQFYIDTYFMRTDRMPLAFGDHQRSSGIFQYGDQHAFIATFAMFYLLFSVKNNIMKVMIVIFYASGLVFTFSRGVWITFLSVLFIHLFFVERKFFIKFIKFAVIPLIVIIFILKPYLPDMNKYLEGNTAMEERVLSDTFTPRMEYNYIVFNTIMDKWMLGYGSLLDNERYYKMMFALGGKDWAQGMQGGIHNLYLSELFLKGFFVAIALSVFLFLFLKYSFQTGFKEKNYLYLLAFYYVFSYALYQMTAAAFLTNYAAVIAVFFMAMISAVKHNDIDISEYVFIPDKDK